MRGVIERLARRTTLQVVDGGDHSFKLPKAAGRSSAAVWDELAGVFREIDQGIERLGGDGDRFSAGIRQQTLPGIEAESADGIDGTYS